MTAIKSTAVTSVIKDVFGRIQDDKLRRVATNCLLSTLDTTIQWPDGNDPFVITGDIPAMWLRDSSCQLEPYIRFTGEDSVLKELIMGVIRRQVFYINEDPYANAFNPEPNDVQGFPHDRTDKNPWVYERKFELDSLCHPIRLWWMFWQATHDRRIFSPDVLSSIYRIIDVFETEQDHSRSSYLFERPHAPLTDTLAFGGKGSPVAATGLIWSGFRPSDDACTYHYLIPAQMFAVVSLHMLRELVKMGFSDDILVRRITDLITLIQGGIDRLATVPHVFYGDIWAYEVNGLGHYNLMDDANVPSLLSLPFIGYCSLDSPQYNRTRRFVLSKYNPYFVESELGSGVGSPHTPAGYFWPIAVMMQALTSDSESEKLSCVDLLLRTDADTGFMHESIDAKNPERYTRSWFAWANSLFAELILRLMDVKSIEASPLLSETEVRF